MDVSQMMMASGGMIAMVLSLVTLLLPLIMLILLWKISKATSTTANQLERLIAQIDQLIQNTAAPAPRATEESAPQKNAPAASSESFDLLAAQTVTAATDAVEEEAADLGNAFSLDSSVNEPEAAAPAEQEEEEDTGFEFPVDDEVFGDLASDEDESDALTAEAAPAAEQDAESFDFSLEEEPAAEEEFASDFGIEEPEEEAAEGLSEEEEAALGGAFDTADETEEPGEESFAATAEQDFSEPPSEEEPEAEAEAEETTPAIVKLDDDPDRPEVSMARCGKCDHKLAYKKTLAGRKARCPSCKEAFILP